MKRIRGQLIELIIIICMLLIIAVVSGIFYLNFISGPFESTGHIIYNATG